MKTTKPALILLALALIAFMIGTFIPFWGWPNISIISSAILSLIAVVLLIIHQFASPTASRLVGIVAILLAFSWFLMVGIGGLVFYKHLTAPCCDDLASLDWLIPLLISLGYGIVLCAAVVILSIRLAVIKHHVVREGIIAQAEEADSQK